MRKDYEKLGYASQTTLIAERLLNGEQTLARAPGQNSVETSILAMAQVQCGEIHTNAAASVKAEIECIEEAKARPEEAAQIEQQSVKSAEQTEKDYGIRFRDAQSELTKVSNAVDAEAIGSSQSKHDQRIRKRKFRNSAISVGAETLVAAIAFSAAGILSGGLVSALFLAGMVPLVAAALGYFMGDKASRWLRRSKSFQEKLIPLALMGASCLFIVFLAYEFASFRSGMEHSSVPYMTPVIMVLTIFIFVYNWMQWRVAPEEDNRLQELLKKQDNLIQSAQDDYETTVEEVDAGFADGRDALLGLLTEKQQRASDARQALRDVGFVNHDYLVELGNIQRAYEELINLHRDQMRRTVEPEIALPGYFHETADLSELFRPTFEYDLLAQKVEHLSGDLDTLIVAVDDAQNVLIHEHEAILDRIRALAATLFDKPARAENLVTVSAIPVE